MDRRLVTLCVLAGCVAPAATAVAATCAAPAGADAGVHVYIGAIDGRARLVWIDQHLGREAARARLWTRAWAIGIGAAGVASLAAVPFVASGDRVDWYTGAATAAIGVVPFVVSPLPVIGDAPKLHAAIAGLPPHDDARVCALLADAEHKLADAAAGESLQQRWFIHAGNIAFNLGVTLFLGIGYHHWLSGLINGVSGAIVGETIIFTQPTGAIRDAAAYHRGDLSADGTGAPASTALGLTYARRF